LALYEVVLTSKTSLRFLSWFRQLDEEVKKERRCPSGGPPGERRAATRPRADSGPASRRSTGWATAGLWTSGGRTPSGGCAWRSVAARHLKRETHKETDPPICVAYIVLAPDAHGPTRAHIPQLRPLLGEPTHAMHVQSLNLIVTFHFS
jgi:hypothetical protein